MFHLRALLIGLACVVGKGAMADEYASAVRTPGNGRYEKNKNYLLFISGTQFQAAIPESVSVGQRIPVRCRVDGTEVSEEFAVVSINIKGDFCHLHNKEVSQYDKSPGDIIFVRPCRKVR